MKKTILFFVSMLFFLCVVGSVSADLSESALARLFDNFSTDYAKRTVDLSEVLSGGPPKDGIPAIDNPRFVTVSAADAWIGDTEPVILYSATTPARVYPIQILMWHEIVNDRVAGESIIVTYCPLCTTGIGFLGTIDGRNLDFGTTGKLRYSNLIMYDRQTETWWQQATGEGIAGKYAGRTLTQVPLQTVPWSSIKEFYPEADVMSKDTGFSRPYGNNPYAGYDRPDSTPFLYQGPRTGSTYSPLDRVLVVMHNDDTRLFSFPELEEKQVVQKRLGGDSVAVFWQKGTASALDSTAIEKGRDVGTANAYLAEVDGTKLSFRLRNSTIVDRQTGTTWNVLGKGIKGPLAGKQLKPLVAVHHFWFSASAFFDIRG